MAGVLTQERVRELFDYNELTGVVTWKVRPRKKANRIKPGDIVTSIGGSGYYRVGIYGLRYPLHIIIWLWMEGYFPEHQIDHINRNKLDNSWVNLRPITPQCNARNTGNFSNTTSGVKGVTYSKKDRIFESYFRVNGKKCTIGRSKDFTEAVAYRLAGEQSQNWEGCDSCSPAYQYMQNYLKGLKCPQE